MSNLDRRDLLASVLADRRQADAANERASLDEFRQRFGLPLASEAVVLYMTLMLDSGDSGRTIRHRLALLDLDARISDRAPWSKHGDVQRWLRGQQREAPRVGSAARADPLYRELVDLLAQVTLLRTRDQIKDIASVLIVNETQLPASALARVQWKDIRRRAAGVSISLPPLPRRGVRNDAEVTLKRRSDRTICPVAALADLRAVRDQSQPLVFGVNGSLSDEAPIRRALTNLPAASPGTWARPSLSPRALRAVVKRLSAPGPQQVSALVEM